MASDLGGRSSVGCSLGHRRHAHLVLCGGDDLFRSVKCFRCRDLSRFLGVYPERGRFAGDCNLYNYE